MLGLVLLGIVEGIVHHGKACCLAATKLSPEAKDEHDIRSGLVHLGKFLPDFSLGDCGLAGMQDIDDLQRGNNQTWLFLFFYI